MYFGVKKCNVLIDTSTINNGLINNNWRTVQFMIFWGAKIYKTPTLK